MKVTTRKAKTIAPGKAPQWKVGYLEVVKNEAHKFLTDEQYAHVKGLFDELACESDPTKSQTQNVEKIDDFYELKDKGGILGKINLRVYFAVIKEKRVILALAAYNKNEEDQTPKYVKRRVSSRLRNARAMLK